MAAVEFNATNISQTEDSGDDSDQHNCSIYFPYEDYTQIPTVRYIFIVIYCVIIFLSVLGNFMVIWTVVRNKHMHTATNYYIVNLAVSDFLVSLIVMPFKLMEYTVPCEAHVFMSNALCGVTSYILPVFVFSSILTLVAISIERYYAVVHPLNTMRFHSKSRTRKILALVWLIPGIVAIPYTYATRYDFAVESHYGKFSRQTCRDKFEEIDEYMFGVQGTRFRKGYYIFLFATIYLLPLTMITFTCVAIAVCLLRPLKGENDILRRRNSFQRRSYQRREENKRKVAKMVVVVASAFFISWTPFYIVNMVSLFTQFMIQSNFLFTQLAVHLFGFINSCVNPFIYSLMSDRFRKSFKQFFGAMFCYMCFKRFSPRSKRHRGSTTMSTHTHSTLAMDDGELADFHGRHKLRAISDHCRSRSASSLKSHGLVKRPRTNGKIRFTKDDLDLRDNLKCLLQDDLQNFKPRVSSNDHVVISGMDAAADKNSLRPLLAVTPADDCHLSNPSNGAYLGRQTSYSEGNLNEIDTSLDHNFSANDSEK
ncbi:QRFP-like peptide receptor [Tubulanus polymorphus]|uniref:QRFP-like peptide receptor n=1 Tax=Tubulanus polymorphus TaxID=672921 RepID=UPI003DA3E8D9